jgi:YggT family protein
MANVAFVIGSILIFLVQVFVLLVFIRVILTWVYGPYATNGFARVLMRITEPVLGPIRRRLPPIAGLDLSPVVVWVGAGVLIGLLRYIL